MDEATARALLEGIHCREPVAGLTHDFYRYPARFSPLFARAAIRAFTEHGDVVMDPFVGGGTTLVEARALGRVGVGVDINPLSMFLVRAKTTILTGSDIKKLRAWGEFAQDALNLRQPAKRAKEWIDLGYQTNLTGKTTWPTRKLLELGLESIAVLANQKQERIARSVLLKTAQWALDCRTEIPSAWEFRQQLLAHLDEVITGALEFRAAALATDLKRPRKDVRHTLVLNRTVEGLEDEPKLAPYLPPRLVLTSPPYPGVHVLYHRWQIKGRRET
ncbi:MAG TPA: DNA methyltransferase, partial [Thermoanaerobaculia bacterium]|nr:DNA methyltransferase [Thermoanaerobaculia bacterium]